jgi:uncharacterized repeat protein (TIGR03803 family)
VFQVNTDGTRYAVIENFPFSSLGTGCNAELTLSGSTLYGTTSAGGSSGNGMVFQVNTNGTGYAVLKNFTIGSDAFLPTAGLTLWDNTLFGTTGGGGIGSVFALTLPLPFTIVTTNGGFGFTNNQFCFTLTGPPGSNAVISASPDLKTWTPLATNPLTSGTLNFTDILATNYLNRFYRATLSP